MPISFFISEPSDHPAILTALVDMEPSVIADIRAEAPMEGLDISVSRLATPTRVAVTGFRYAWRSWLMDTMVPPAMKRNFLVAMTEGQPTMARLGSWHAPLTEPEDSSDPEDLPRISAARIAEWLAERVPNWSPRESLGGYRRLLHNRPACLFRHQACLRADGWRAFEQLMGKDKARSNRRPPKGKATSVPYPDSATGALGFRAGDRFVYDLDGRHGRADLFLQDGDAYVTFDDQTQAVIKWNHMSPEVTR